MALSSGTRLGPYEIIAAIGAGGMGEVYRARDTRLDRTVAIKVIAHDLKLQLQWIAATPDTAPGVRPRASWRPLLWAAIAVAVVLAAVVLATWRSGTPVARIPMRAHVLLPLTAHVWNIELSPDGRKLAMIAGLTGGQNKLWVQDLAGGKAQRVVGAENIWSLSCSPDSIRLSPDNSRVAAGIGTGTGAQVEVWTMDVNRDTPMRLTFDHGAASLPVWSPDGKKIAYFSDRSGTIDLYVRPSDGSGEGHLLLHDNDLKNPTDWSPDGQYLVYTAYDQHGAVRAMVLHLDANEKPFPLVPEEVESSEPQFSPDGRWVAYSAGESGRVEVFVRSFRGPGGKWQASVGGGHQPRWSRDGKQLFFLAGQNRTLMGIEVRSAGNSVELSAPRALFEISGVKDLTSQYDIARDGRFLVNIQVQGEAKEPPTVILNWDAALGK